MAALLAVIAVVTESTPGAVVDKLFGTGLSDIGGGIDRDVAIDAIPWILAATLFALPLWQTIWVTLRYWDIPGSLPGAVIQRVNNRAIAPACWFWITVAAGQQVIATDLSSWLDLVEAWARGNLSIALWVLMPAGLGIGIAVILTLMLTAIAISRGVPLSQLRKSLNLLLPYLGWAFTAPISLAMGILWMLLGVVLTLIATPLRVAAALLGLDGPARGQADQTLAHPSPGSTSTGSDA